MKTGQLTLFGRLPKADKPWQPRAIRCRACLRETADLVKGVCTDRAACEERQPALFSP